MQFKPLNYIDQKLNSITMYMLMIVGLSALIGFAVLMSLLGQLPISSIAIIASSTVILTAGYIADRTLPVIWGTARNSGSSLITSLILCFILPPTTSIHYLAIVGLGTIIAVASKYLIAYRHKHLFNPAAFAALILGVSNLDPATWWIGTKVMIPITLIVGLLVLRKLRKVQLFCYFLASSLLISIFLADIHHLSLVSTVISQLKSSPLIFLGTIMLSEPSTLPIKLEHQKLYAVVVGTIFSSQLSFGNISATPELTLIIGNVYSFSVNPKYKLKLKFKARRSIGTNLYDLAFSGANNLHFQPGQYLEWTLPLPHTDIRGNRRIFSIASAPDENDIHIAIKAFNPGSSFKQKLLELRFGDEVVVGQLAGEFVMPNSETDKLVFIAGGIGITPFVSMVKTIIKQRQNRDIVLIYLVSKPDEYCYQKIWQQAENYGLRTIPVLTDLEASPSWTGKVGRLTSEMLVVAVPDYLERKYFISGPHGLVASYETLLRQLRIKRQNIKTDHFSGY